MPGSHRQRISPVASNAIKSTDSGEVAIKRHVAIDAVQKELGITQYRSNRRSGVARLEPVGSGCRFHERKATP